MTNPENSPLPKAVAYTAIVAALATTAGFIGTSLQSYWSHQLALKKQCDEAITSAVVAFSNKDNASGPVERGRARLILVAALECKSNAALVLGDMAEEIATSDRCNLNSKGKEQSPIQACVDAFNAYSILHGKPIPDEKLPSRLLNELKERNAGDT